MIPAGLDIVDTEPSCRSQCLELCLLLSLARLDQPQTLAQNLARILIAPTLYQAFDKGKLMRGKNHVARRHNAPFVSDLILNSLAVYANSGIFNKRGPMEGLGQTLGARREAHWPRRKSVATTAAMSRIDPWMTELPLAFCGNPLDRVEERRGDAAWLERALPSGRFLVLVGDRVCLRGGAPPALKWHDHADIAPRLAAGAECVLLGVDTEATPCFAVSMPDDEWRREGNKDIVYLDARSAVLQWADSGADEGQSGILAQGLAILRWHARHRFCACCGALTESRRGGYQRYCSACDTEHFPRTDPVAIMLVIRGEHCLLGRQARFPAGMYSALAGFVEAGESVEAAVRREVHEEAGVRVGRVRYLGSQPWPFPASLMMGFLAEGVSGDITVDERELEDARWVHRDELRKALAGEEGSALRLPPPIAIARHLIARWLAGETLG